MGDPALFSPGRRMKMKFNVLMDAIQDYMPAMDLQGAFAGLPDTFLFGLWYVDTAYTVAIIVPAYALYFAFGRKSVFGG